MQAIPFVLKAVAGAAIGAMANKMTAPKAPAAASTAAAAEATRLQQATANRAAEDAQALAAERSRETGRGARILGRRSLAFEGVETGVGGLAASLGG